MTPTDDRTTSAPTLADGETRWTEFICWLEQLSGELPLYGKQADQVICERLIAGLHKCEEEDAAFDELDAMGPVVRQCFAGTRSFLRAIAAGYVELSPGLRSDLVDVVREISEVIMAHDLENPEGA